MKTKRAILILVLLLILTIIAVEPLSFVKVVRIGDGDSVDNTTQIRKSGGLRCKWAYSADVVNITVNWYNNSVFHDTVTFNAPTLKNFTDILPTALVEEEIWNCTVIMVNSSGSTINSSALVEIIYDPSVFINSSGSHQPVNLTFEEIYEDSSYSLIWNTTGSFTSSTFTIGAPAQFCTDSSPATSGAGTCFPNTSYLGTDVNTSNTAVITFQYDHLGGTQKNRINFTIIPVNDPPQLSMNDTVINEGDEWSGVPATITVTDEEGNFPINFTVDVPSFCSTTNNTDNIVFNCTPNALQVGNYTINLTALDNPPVNSTYPLTPENTTISFILSVISINHDPNITFVSNDTSSQGLVYNITVNATDKFDNNNLTFTFTGNCNITNPWTNVTSMTNITYDGQNFTSYGNGTWTGTLNNSHIVCRNVTILVTDGLGGSNSTVVYFNISNVNDPPTINNFSANPLGSSGNNYINNLTGFEQSPFVYQINASDVDLLVDYDPTIDPFNESLLYLSNSSWLNQYLDNRTGLINITGANMNLTLGNYTFLINVSDAGTPMYNATVVMSIEVRPNTPPQWNQDLNFTCLEFDSINYNISCFINLSLYAFDTDPGDSIQTFVDDSSEFVVDTTTGLLNFSALQSQVGINVFNVTISDIRSASNETTMYLYVVNTNNKPNISDIESRDPPVALYINSSQNNKIPITAFDHDLNLTGTNASDLNYSYERLNFTWVNNNQSQNLSGYISIIPNLTTVVDGILLIINTTVFVNGSQLPLGRYSINITVKDNYLNFSGNVTQDSDFWMYNFTVYNVTGPPVITAVYPYGQPWANQTTFDWRNITETEIVTLINVSENVTLFFNQTNVDDQGNVTYQWFYDGEKLASTNTINGNSSATMSSNNESLTFFFGFYESFDNTTTHSLRVDVVDGFDISLNDSFTWNISVTHLNRPLYLNSPIANLTILGTSNANDEDLWTAGDAGGFYDPDYDVDGSGTIDFAESNYSINYTILNNTCGGLGTISVDNPYSFLFDSGTNTTWISGHGIVASAVDNGTCNISLQASDGEFTAISNVIQVNFTTTTGSSGPANTETVVVNEGVLTKTKTITEEVEIPLPEEVDTPIPIDIVLPDLVTVYENNTIEIPLTLTNTWNETVSGVRLYHEFGNGTTINYSVSFARTDFFQILPGEVINTHMIVSNYRVGEVYEILVFANVTDPPYLDSAKIYLNSIEQTSTGVQVRTLIRFARDLLQENKECQELGEVLDKAESLRQNGDLLEAMDLIESVINGCKYLISQEQQIVESPGRFRRIYVPVQVKWVLYTLLAIGLGIGGYSGYRYFERKRKEKEEREKQKKEEAKKTFSNFG